MAAILPQAQQVLDFWFDELSPEAHFARDPLLDETIRERFGILREALFDTGAEGWQELPQTVLAAVIVLDQFSRNIYRDSAEAFAADPLALALALGGIARGHHAGLDASHRAFLYMPLMHCENRGVQLFSVACFSEPGLEHYLDFARQHADVIEKFGRFPGRNKALKRRSTKAEKEYLARPGAKW